MTPSGNIENIIFACDAGMGSSVMGVSVMKNIMKKRLSKGFDPLTGEKMETIGKISFNGKCCVDATGKEVTLNDNGTWIYK